MDRAVQSVRRFRRDACADDDLDRELISHVLAGVIDAAIDHSMQDGDENFEAQADEDDSSALFALRRSC